MGGIGVAALGFDSTYSPETLSVVEVHAVLANLLQDGKVVLRVVGSVDGGVAGEDG